jgi:leucyl aminopeptidase (aminopeptidase T)
LVRDHAGRLEVLEEFLLAIEQRGGTPLPELTAPDYLRRLLQTVPASHLAAWDRCRLEWGRTADRVLVLEGADLDAAGVPADALAAWTTATDRLGAAEAERRLPYLLVAVPTVARAAALALPLPELEAALLPALAADPAALRSETARLRAAFAGGRRLTIVSGAECALRLALGDRTWLEDDGVASAEDQARGAQVVMNLPSGALYTTVLEAETSGRLRLTRRGDDADATLTFELGSVVEVTGGAEAEAIRGMFDRHSGDARRVGHVGVGLNPWLRQPLGWPLVDIHVRGCLLVSFGENRYLGGQNASSLNVDFALPDATLLVDGRVVIEAGAVVV